MGSEFRVFEGFRDERVYRALGLSRVWGGGGGGSKTVTSMRKG